MEIKEMDSLNAIASGLKKHYEKIQYLLANPDKFKNIDELYKGKALIENIEDSLIEEIYREEYISAAKLDLERDPFPNEYFILRNNKKSALGTFNKDEKVVRLVLKRRGYGIVPRNAEQTFALDALMNDAIPLVTLSGKAGTGKTLPPRIY